MNHWRGDFVNRPLPRVLYIAVRWASLMELRIALRVRRELTRLGLLCDVDVDFARSDEDQEMDHQQSRRRLSLPLGGPSPPLMMPRQGVWV